MTTVLKFFVLNKTDKEENLKKQELINNIRGIKKEIDTAYCIFQNSNDEDLIEASIYELEALTKRYQSLIKKAKEENLECGDLTALYDFERRRFGS